MPVAKAKNIATKGENPVINGWRNTLFRFIGLFNCKTRLATIDSLRCKIVMVANSMDPEEELLC